MKSKFPATKILIMSLSVIIYILDKLNCQLLKQKERVLVSGFWFSSCGLNFGILPKIAPNFEIFIERS